MSLFNQIGRSPVAVVGGIDRPPFTVRGTVGCGGLVAADWWRCKGDAVHAVGPGGALSLSWGGRGAPRRGRRRGDLGLHAAVDGGRTSTDGPVRLSYPGLIRLVSACFLSQNTIKSAKISWLSDQPNTPMGEWLVVVANRFSVANLPLAVPCFRGHPLPNHLILYFPFSLLVTSGCSPGGLCVNHSYWRCRIRS